MFSSVPIIATLALSMGIEAAPSRALRRSQYPGFNKLESMFVFGDSWSRTGFDTSSTQPSASNPLGNPDYPGRTSANGPNWVTYLTTTYNESLLLTYNFGTSGATLDSDLVTSNFDVLDELNELFIPYYATTADGPWTSASTLFAVWIGVNDINRSYMSDYVALNAQIFAQYRAVLDNLYELGARNFLLLNAPPLERSPSVTGFETAPVRIPRCLNDTIDWNTRLESLQSDIEGAYQDATVFYLDINTLFNQVIDDPTQFEQTAGYKNTTAYCEAYIR
ncbi:hypothetical protein BJY01DRAFT_231388 [Aspergillus pseudoustus]|uniref:GDSL lipase/esterase n=1 Tax=Aspergillus pseudoustus TaxID=1810923 RepID=A0ABR4KUJ8_9EURO